MTTEKSDKKEPKTDSRQAAWAAFLEKAREENPERFDAQKKNGEFDKIPADFTS